MAKGKGQPNTPEKKKRGFWANFFEPLPFDTDEDYPDGELDDEVFDEDEDEEEDAPPKKAEKEKREKKRAGGKKKRRSLWDYANEDFDEDEDEDEEPPETPKDDKPKTKKKKKRAADEPPPEPDVSADTEDAEEAPDDADDGDTDDSLTVTQHLPEPDALDSGEETSAPKQADEKIVLFDEDGEDEEDIIDEGVEDEDIRLFEDGEYADEPPRKKKRGARTTIVRTGAGTAARVAINETEELLSTEQAQKERRKREAERKHREYVEKQRQKRQRKRMMQRAAGNVAFGAFIVIGVILAMYYTFLLSDIIVTGNEAYAVEYIIEQSGLKYGQHMFTVKLDEAEENIEEDPYLQVDSITYIFPSRVRIVVTERKEVAGIIGLDYNVIIDENGYVLAMGAGTDISGLLQVTGINMTGFQLGQRLGESDDFSTATLITMIGKLKAFNLMGNVKAIDLTTPLATTMTASNGLKIHVGQPTDLDTKFQSLSENMPTFFKQNIYWGTLFLSSKGGAVWSPREMSDILADTVAVPEEGETGGDTVPWTDLDGDGNDDETGLPYVPQTPIPSVSPTPMGSGGDEFQG